MKIVIPMSGFGERFRRAGYTVPKPLIPVEGKPIIAHVLELFPGEEDVLFICNRDHLEATGLAMAETLRRLRPSAEIAAIEPHKLGPVYAVAQVSERLDADQPTIVNYCDFACYWDYAHFKRFVAETACDGAIPAYRGFHPHSLGAGTYAYMREQDGWVSDIQEKTPFTATPLAEYASSGTYYFASGEILRNAVAECLRQGLEVGGEHYVSLAYKPLLEEGRAVAVYELQHFMQWGTPEDLAEYERWSRAFARLGRGRRAPPRQVGAVMVPMAGLGARFAAAGYEVPKPLIPVSGEPMVVQAVADLPQAEQRVFVLRRDLPGLDEITGALRARYPESRLVMLEAPTDGQARTCLLAMDGLDPERPLTIGACDNGALYDAAAFEALLAAPESDVLVWAARGHPGAARQPQAYGWLESDGDRISRVSVKTPLAAPATDPIVIGAFTFKRARDFVAAAERMIEREARVGGEFYIDTCINDAIALGLTCRLFEVDHYLCWGTPDELRSFEYWQSCFHKWPAHGYRLECDGDVPAAARAALERRYAAFEPPWPGPRP